MNKKETIRICSKCEKKEVVNNHKYAALINIYDDFLCSDCSRKIKEEKRKRKKEESVKRAANKYQEKLISVENTSPSYDELNNYILSGKPFSVKSNKCTPSLLSALKHSYPQIENYAEAFYLYKKKMEKPHCPICGTPLLFMGSSNGYGKTCGKKECTLQQRFNTCELKYGGSGPASSSIVQEKMKQTNLERYGVENGGNTKEGRDKARKTYLEKYGVDNPNKLEITKEKIVNTCLEKYGVRNGNQSEKRKETCLEKYGCDHPNFRGKDPLKVEIWRNKDKLEKFLREESGSYIDELACKLDITPYSLWGKIHAFGLDSLINARTGSSKGEDELFDYIKSVYGGEIIRNYRGLISPYELDIYLPEKNLALEYNGNYWHSEKNLLKKKSGGISYHQNKHLMCKEKDVFLIQIFEHEWKNDAKREKLKKYLKDIISGTSSIYARKCKIREIDYNTYESFMNKNHLQGSDRAPIRIGLYYENALYACMSFSKPRFNKNYEYELARYVNKIGYRVVGGASKLLKYFEKAYNPSSIISYCDLSKMKGDLYKNLNFTSEKNSPPNYVWFKGDKIKTRYQCQLHKLKEQGYEGTEDSIMENLGYEKIYDAGNSVWVKHYTNASIKKPSY